MAPSGFVTGEPANAARTSSSASWFGAKLFSCLLYTSDVYKRQVLEQVAPGNADELLERTLQREAEEAHRQRSLRFFHEGASVRFDGSLPRVEAERWIAQLDAQSEAQRRTAIEARRCV